MEQGGRGPVFNKETAVKVQFWCFMFQTCYPSFHSLVICGQLKGFSGLRKYLFWFVLKLFYLPRRVCQMVIYKQEGVPKTWRLYAQTTMTPWVFLWDASGCDNTSAIDALGMNWDGVNPQMLTCRNAGTPRGSKEVNKLWFIKRQCTFECQFIPSIIPVFNFSLNRLLWQFISLLLSFTTI